jgi:hypothetical protein
MISDGLQNSKVKLWHKWLQQQLVAELRHFAVELLEKRYSIEVLEKSGSLYPILLSIYLHRTPPFYIPPSSLLLTSFFQVTSCLQEDDSLLISMFFSAWSEFKSTFYHLQSRNSTLEGMLKDIPICSSHIAHDKP